MIKFMTGFFVKIMWPQIGEYQENGYTVRVFRPAFLAPTDSWHELNAMFDYRDEMGKFINKTRKGKKALNRRG